jgi:hypothetical protein
VAWFRRPGSLSGAVARSILRYRADRFQRIGDERRESHPMDSARRLKKAARIRKFLGCMI